MLPISGKVLRNIAWQRCVPSAQGYIQYSPTENILLKKKSLNSVSAAINNDYTV